MASLTNKMSTNNSILSKLLSSGSKSVEDVNIFSTVHLLTIKNLQSLYQADQLKFLNYMKIKCKKYKNKINSSDSVPSILLECQRKEVLMIGCNLSLMANFIHSCSGLADCLVNAMLTVESEIRHLHCLCNEISDGLRKKMEESGYVSVDDNVTINGFTGSSKEITTESVHLFSC